MSIEAKNWTKKDLPKRILAIRLQAMGDTVITLPYLQHLRNTLPGSVEIDLLTRVETELIPKNLVLFNNVYSIAGKRNLKMQLFFTLLLLPKLFFRRYDIIIDLQNNILSRLTRKTLKPTAWSEFDRFSPIAAGERTRQTIEAVGLGKNRAVNKFALKSDLAKNSLLIQNGWDGKKDLIALNPAGVSETRNWPLNNYVNFAKLWLEEFPQTQFLIAGLPFISSKADWLQQQLKNDVVNIVGKTNVAETFCILQGTKFMLSEDSGLMHMAWVSGIPTLALFGSTRSDWSRPLGDHTAFVDSSDLDCGNCMQGKCKWGDNRCLTRYDAEFIFEKAKALIRKAQTISS